MDEYLVAAAAPHHRKMNMVSGANVAVTMSAGSPGVDVMSNLSTRVDRKRATSYGGRIG